MDYRELKQEFEDALELVEKKNKDYGNAKEVAGQIMKIIFKDGVGLRTANDFNEFNMLVMIFSKILRVCNLHWNSKLTSVNFESVDDTLKDLGNYAFILKNMINNNRAESGFPPVASGKLVFKGKCECGHLATDHTFFLLTGAPCIKCDCANYKEAQI